MPKIENPIGIRECYTIAYQLPKVHGLIFSSSCLYDFSSILGESENLDERTVLRLHTNYELCSKLDKRVWSQTINYLPQQGVMYFFFVTLCYLLVDHKIIINRPNCVVCHEEFSNPIKYFLLWDDKMCMIVKTMWCISQLRDNSCSHSKSIE